MWNLQQCNPEASPGRLNFATVVLLTQSMETAAKNVKELQQPSGHLLCRQVPIKVTQPRQGKKILPTCHCCGKTGHKARQCSLKHLKCFQCGKVGHLQSV